MKKYSIIICLVFPIILFGQSTTKIDLLDRLISIQKTHESLLLIVDQLIEEQKEEDEIIDDEYWDKLNQKIKSEGVKDLIDLLLPIYDKHFTEDQLIAIVEFYESEVGEHLIKTQTDIFFEAKEVGEKWGEEIAQKIIDEIQLSNDSLMNVTLVNCEQFKTGRFQMIMPDSSLIFLEREHNVQTEIYDDSEYLYSIEWIEPCKYVIREINSENKDAAYDITVNIFRIEGNKYHYIAKGTDISMYDKAEITKIE